jgi:prepilin-type N-terminal cleavage/methylation domain-containing protein
MSATRGFSLIELLITLTITGIVLAVALPGLGRFRDSMTLKRANAQVLQDVRRARQLAITRRAQVVMRFGTPPSTTNITQYTIHVDTNSDRLVQSSEIVTMRNLPSGTRLSSVDMAPVDSLTFDFSGLLWNGTGGRIVIANRLDLRDTLLVSAAGVCFEP